MASADGSGEMRLADLPVEIRCRIMGFLPTADIPAARLAHRCLAIEESALARASREHAIWLRTSPERACALGRIDVVTYLYGRRRIPRTINLTAAAVRSGSMDMVNLVRQRCPLWNEDIALASALTCPNPHLVYALLSECTRGHMDAFAVHTVNARRDDVIDWLILTDPPGWRTDGLLTRAIECDNVLVVRSMCLSGAAQQKDRHCAFNKAITFGSLKVAQFLHDLGDCRAEWSTLVSVRRSSSTMRFLLSLPGHDAKGLMYKEGTSMDVLRLLCEAYPEPSRQALLDRAPSIQVAHYACEIDPHVDLDRGLDAAVADERFDVVRFLYLRGAHIEPAIYRNKVDGRPKIVYALVGIMRDHAGDNARRSLPCRSAKCQEGHAHVEA
ncbi:hypothetical protein pmac_cds_502 [Pandoravirus macleodensis]|uniref:Ankyrin repeat domain containing protein n=1 Tax=Pandoravirus macleodensis TaxID=2107707 RepID=A0A2U7UFU7_9VIRU|nr:hypothetical protein pmac_cds_502 [Pandoravirus macleodensis]AVK77190.1 hypothetical protein pmac_cds_502 [Pandoravirus macleodensis]